MRPCTGVLLIILAAFVAAIAGVIAGRVLTVPAATPAAELHAVLHDRMDLNPDQTTRLDALEHVYAVRRAAIERRMRADNTVLAAAIETEHGYGPGVAAAVDRTHATMGELQKATLAHIFAMRQVLTPRQAPQFDAAVVKALTDDSHAAK